MRFFLIPAIVLLVVNALVDVAIYRSIVYYCKRGLASKIQLVSAVALALAVIIIICLPKRNGSNDEFVFVQWGLYTYLTIYIPKYIYLLFYLMSRLPSVVRRKGYRPLAAAGGVVALAVFCLMWWGALVNRYNIQVVRQEVAVKELPSAFDGFTIAQISDLHVGTWGRDTAFVSKLVDSINSLHPDMIVFTGDIVNRNSREAEPFVGPLSRLSAPYGVYSVLGNHDYGDYSDWPTLHDKEADVENLKRLQVDGMHWRMLNNTTAWIKVAGDSIALIGVENIGDPPFTVYGDLASAYPDVSDGVVKILLSHNPAHWEQDIADNSASNIALTLSGHTHAMQMELMGVSPAALRYDKWGGMYADAKGQRLYVNIGAGEVGMPYRIGATPEITLFKLIPETK